MATTYKDGSAWIVETGSGRARRRVRFPGSLSERAIGTIAGHVQDLTDARIAGTRPLPATLAWVDALADKVHERLARAGLVDARAKVEAVTLKALCVRWKSASSVKPSTVRTYAQTADALIETFGAHTPITSITPAMCDDWRAEMVKAKLAGPTIAKRIRTARSMFKLAVSLGFVPSNPLADVRGGGMVNTSRRRFITMESIEKISASLPPGSEWRIALMLARAGGLRVPSELRDLRWTDVLWSENKIIVRPSKTQGYAGHDVRHVPLFAPLRAVLLDAFERAPAGAEFVCPKLRLMPNLRTQVLRLAERAGVTLGPKPLVNMRASRATELVAEYPGHAVAAWLGHSEEVARKHYLTVPDSMYHEAAASKSGQNPGQHRGNSDGTDRNAPPAAASEPALCGVERSGAETEMTLWGFEPQSSP